MKLELDRETIENAIRATKSLAKSICDGLESDDEIIIQMAYNAALFISASFETLNDLKGAYITTGIHIARDESIDKDKLPTNPHPIYVWEEEEDEEIKQRLDKLIDILSKS